MFRFHRIADHERGLLTADGMVRAWLAPGRHTVWTWPIRRTVARIDLNDHAMALTPELDAVIPASAAARVQVGHGHVALVTVDGVPTRVLAPGRHLVWTQRHAIDVQVVDVRPLVLDLAPAWLPLLPPDVARVVQVHPYQRALLYVDGALADVLGAGRHVLGLRDRTIEVAAIDLREQQFQITGQEVMTADQVTLRTNIVLCYRVVDPVVVHEATRDLHAALYSEAQLAVRSVIAGRRLDALLAERNAASAELADRIGPRAAAWGVQITALDLKDVVLPGDLKTILNQVIEAEKQAAAQVILRREETAATRSLANTARLLDQNPVLMRLKELEALQRIAGEVDQVHVVAGADELMGRLKLSG